MLQGATANVIMQLALRPVGHGVIHGSVESGNVFKHPMKRLRTTLSYLAVATLGTDAEIDAYREAVNRVHRQVQSAPGAEVKFNAFNKDLQLWVAACLYMGFVLGHEALHGPLDEDVADHLYQEAATLGTSLQVTRDQWPTDRAAFAVYWEQGLARCEIDDMTRKYLWSLTNLEQLPAWLRWPFAPSSRFFTIGFLPQVLRDQMQATWSSGQQRRFDRFFRACGWVSRFSPRPVREFPFNIYMWDVRRRIRAGKPLV
ncbi:hypothetical protein C6I20_09765 [Aeromicrobium sp. A1-2]|nr:hypothetical protein C6I20_09765 [Aeromicrobium sp. A1-2]